MLKRRLASIASRVRLGVATLNVTAGGPTPPTASDVKEDMVMARGWGRLCWPSDQVGGRDVAPPPARAPALAGSVEVHTTTEWASRRIRPRSCSPRGREGFEREEVGWMDGGSGGIARQVCGHEEAVRSLIGMSAGINVSKDSCRGRELFSFERAHTIEWSARSAELCPWYCKGGSPLKRRCTAMVMVLRDCVLGRAAQNAATSHLSP